MKTYDRNRNAITTGSRVMISDTGLTGRITAIDTDGLTAEQILPREKQWKSKDVKANTPPSS